MIILLVFSPVFAAQTESDSQGSSFQATGYITHTSQLGLNSGNNPLPLLDHSLVALDQTAEIARNTSQTLSLNGGVVGAKPVPMKFLIVREPGHGVLDKTRLAEGVVIYTPEKDFEGRDSFLFTLDAGEVRARAAAVTLKVVPSPQAVSGNTPATGGGLTPDPLTAELNKRSAAFFKEQRDKKRIFFQDLRAKNLTPDELQKEIIDFRKDELSREQKYQERQRRFIDKRGDESFLGQAKDAAEDLALFFKLRDPSVQELNQQRLDFFAKQKEKSVRFFQDLNKETLTSDDRGRKIQDFQAAALERQRKFLEKRNEIIRKQAQDVDQGNNSSDEDVKNEIIQFFKNLF